MRPVLLVVGKDVGADVDVEVDEEVAANRYV